MCPELVQAVQRWEGMQNGWNPGKENLLELLQGEMFQGARIHGAWEHVRLLSTPSGAVRRTGSVTAALQLVSWG